MLSYWPLLHAITTSRVVSPMVVASPGLSRPDPEELSLAPLVGTCSGAVTTCCLCPCLLPPQLQLLQLSLPPLPPLPPFKKIRSPPSLVRPLKLHKQHRQLRRCPLKTAWEPASRPCQPPQPLTTPSEGSLQALQQPLRVPPPPYHLGLTPSPLRGRRRQPPPPTCSMASAPAAPYLRSSSSRLVEQAQEAEDSLIFEDEPRLALCGEHIACICSICSSFKIH